MLFSLFYECMMWIAFLCFLPKGIYQAIRHKKYRSSTWLRFGFRFPKILRKGNGPIFWIHAVSVGESQAASSLVKKIKKEIQDAVVIVSTVTETAQANAKKTIDEADAVVFLPFDFFFVVRHVLKRSKPDCVILVETDFWWRFLHEAKRQGACTMVASGKLSEKSFQIFKRFSFFTKRLFSEIDAFCLQDATYMKRFEALKLPKARLFVTGNIKADVELKAMTDEEKSALQKLLGIKESDFVITVGSSHDPEEKQILEQLLPLLQKMPTLKLVIVPRHPHRFLEVKTLIQSFGLSLSCYSEIVEGKNQASQVILIDAMGKLISCYQIATLAIVAGSFTAKIGGHNILEPLYFGVPTLCGVYMHTQQQFLEIAKKAGAIKQVEIQDLLPCIQDLIQNEDERKVLTENGLRMISKQKGAVDRTMRVIEQLVPDYFSKKISP